VTAPLVLSPAEVEALTSHRRSDAQRRELDHMGIPFRARRDGSLAVLRRDVEHHTNTTPKPREPELHL